MKGISTFLNGRPGVLLQIGLLLAGAPVLARLSWGPLALAVPALLAFWLAQDSLAGLGLEWRGARWLRWLAESVVVGLLSAVIIAGLLTPWLQRLLHVTPAAFNRAGDGTYLVASLLRVWLVNALAGGLVFRVFLLHRLEKLLNPLTEGRVTAAVAGAILFGLSVYPQGAVGMLAATAAVLVFNLFFYWSGRNFWPTFLAHGLYNSTFFVLIFLGRM